MQPLASKNRPLDLTKFVGQEHLVGVGKPLRLALEQKHAFSFILWGPPGSGKTTLARLYGKALGLPYHELSAVLASKEDIRAIVEGDKKSRTSKKVDTITSLIPLEPAPQLLFLDEIHRFTKAQQDFLLPYVETGELILIGATTENPSFEVIAALLSRCQVFTLNALSSVELHTVIKNNGFEISSEAEVMVSNIANGDARQALSLLEKTQKFYKEISVDTLSATLQNLYIRYDKKGEEHYNTISAFIKSMRASQPNAALYYLARMIHAGEDPIFIARRLVIFASEDIGLEDPQALLLANAAFRAVEIIGYPECSINLSHVTCYLALAPKSKRTYYAYNAALEDVRKMGNLAIPLSIRNAPTPLMKDLGYGKGYKKYTTKDLLPTALQGKIYLEPEDEQ